MVVRLLRDSWRAWRASPALALASVCTLALGLGATTTFYALVDHLLLQPLPVPHPEQLVHLTTSDEPRGTDITLPVWEQLREQDALTAGAYAWTSLRVNLAPRGDVDVAQAVLASGGVFRTLQVPALLGRVFDERDDVADGGPDGWVAVLTHASWQRRFGGDADIIGRRIDVERVPVTIIGVLPPSFRGLHTGTSVDLILPLQAETRVRAFSLIASGRMPFLSVVMRLAPAVSREALAAALRAAQPAIREATRQTVRRVEDEEAFLRAPFDVAPASDGGTGLVAYYGQAVAMLLALGVLVLLACCGNVATVLLAHGAQRQQELAVRVALGASRWEPARQLVADALLLSMAGVVAAVAFAAWLGPWLMTAWHQPMLDASLHPARSWRVWAMACGAGALTSLLCAWAAARRAVRHDAADLLRGGARHTVRVNAQQRLIALQLAFSTVVLVTSLLLIRSYTGVTTAPALARLAPVVVAELRLSQSSLPPEEREATITRVRRAVEAAIPGSTTSAAIVVPFYGGAYFWAVQTTDRASSLQDRLVLADAVTPSHFVTLGVPLVAGRSFDGSEPRGAPLVAVVNRTFARRFFGGDARVPQRVLLDAGQDVPREVDVVGVVEDVPYENITEEPHAVLYLSRAQEVPNDRHAFLLVRGGTGRPASAAAVRAAILDSAPELSFAMTSLPRAARDQFARERVLALVAGFFAVVAVLVAGVGVLGVTSHAVTTRRREIGIRMAVGALPRQVRGLILGRALRTTLLGTTGGLLVAWWSTRLVAALLVKTDAHDPRVFSAVGVLLVALGVLSAWWPARHAARLDPAAVLRSE